MPIRHRLLAVVVAVLWGANFIAIHASLEVFPPFLCAALRFLLLAIPTIAFVPRPQVPTRWLLGYGVGFGVLQFTFLYLGMSLGMPAGLASLVLQSSAPFTVVLGAVLIGERVPPRAAAGLGLAALGMAVVGSQRLSGEAGILPFVLTLLAGLGWAFGNLAARLAAPPRPLHLAMWMTVVPPVPMLLLSAGVESPGRMWDALVGSLSTDPEALLAWGGLAYTALVATVVGSGLWTWLMSRHHAGSVAPFSLLVPITGLTLAWALLGETPAPLELLGGALVIIGVWATASRRSDVPVTATEPPRSPTRAEPERRPAGERRAAPPSPAPSPSSR